MGVKSNAVLNVMPCTGMDRRKTDVGPTGVRQSDKHHCQGGPTLASRAGRYERVRSFLLLERLVLLLPRRLTVIRKKNACLCR